MPFRPWHWLWGYMVSEFEADIQQQSVVSQIAMRSLVFQLYKKPVEPHTGTNFPDYSVFVIIINLII